jgi:hypothetical protein
MKRATPFDDLPEKPFAGMGDGFVDSVTPLFAIRLVRQITPGCARAFSHIYSVRLEERMATEGVMPHKRLADQGTWARVKVPSGGRAFIFPLISRRILYI